MFLTILYHNIVFGMAWPEAVKMAWRQRKGVTEYMRLATKKHKEVTNDEYHNV